MTAVDLNGLAANDTSDTLARRIMAEERQAFPEAITRNIAEMLKTGLID